LTLLKRRTITEDPLLTNQVIIEEEKSKVLKKRTNPYSKLSEFVDLSHKQSFIDEKRKKKSAGLVKILNQALLNFSLVVERKRRNLKGKERKPL